MIDDRYVREDFLPFCLPTIDDDDIAEVVDTLRSGWLTTGPKTQRFEEEFRNYIGAPCACAVSSGTAALHLALLAVGIGDGAEVITSPYTFSATAEAIIHAGGSPVFVDIDERTLNIDPDKVAAAVGPRTRAILPVHLAGYPCDMDAILGIARQHGLRVVEDAAHAIGTEYRGRKVGTFGDASAFSFYVTKNITTGEGGMVTTGDASLAETIRLLRLHGIGSDAWRRYGKGGSWYYEVKHLGFKYNLTDLQAALGIQQLRRVEEFLRRRAELARLYSDELADVDEIEVPQEPEAGRHAWHLYVVRLRLERLAVTRAHLIETLTRCNVGVSVHFIPLHLHPFYQQCYGLRAGAFPVAERAYERVVSLPIYPRMTARDVLDVVRAIKWALARHALTRQ